MVVLACAVSPQLIHVSDTWKENSTLVCQSENGTKDEHSVSVVLSSLV